MSDEEFNEELSDLLDDIEASIGAIGAEAEELEQETWDATILN